MAGHTTTVLLFLTSFWDCGAFIQPPSTLRALQLDLCRNPLFDPGLGFEETEKKFPKRPHTGPPIPNDVFLGALKGRRALEIGGPTDMLVRAKFYSLFRSCDNVNWELAQEMPYFAAREKGMDMEKAEGEEGQLEVESSNIRAPSPNPAPRPTSPTPDCGLPSASSKDFVVDGAVLGKFFSGDATDLSLLGLAGDSYDLIFASHTLEHLRNPLRALLSWDRVLAPGGNLLLIVPWRNGMYDRYRQPSNFQTLLQDYYWFQQEDTESLQTPSSEVDRRSEGSDVRQALNLSARDQARVEAQIEVFSRLTDVQELGFATPAEYKRFALLEPRGFGEVHWHVWSFDLLEQVAACLDYDVILRDLVDRKFHAHALFSLCTQDSESL